MISKKVILVINSSSFISGAEISLIQYLRNLNELNVKILIVIPKTAQYLQLLPSNCEIIFLPLIWFERSINPFYLFKCLINVIFCSLKIIKIIRNREVDILYSNSIKSQIYGVFIKLLTKKKLIWHIRDNLKNDLLTRFLIKNSDKIICISEFIYLQLNISLTKKLLIYGGIDVDEWQPFNGYSHLKERLGILPETKIIAQIGQLTSWKNHFDFIKVANEIIQRCPKKVHFLIVGENLSGKEKKYKKQLETEIIRAGLERHFSFLGFIKNIKEIYAQIDVLVHPAIDEPFGRVVVEAMAMEKPIVAYNCGGPKEIIVNNQTGFLVKTYNYKAMTEKIIALLMDSELQIKLGKAGRLRVIEEFNLKDYVYNMEALFNSM